MLLKECFLLLVVTINYLQETIIGDRNNHPTDLCEMPFVSFWKVNVIPSVDQLMKWLLPRLRFHVL